MNDDRIERLSARMDARFDALYRLMVQSLFGILVIVMIGGSVAVSAALIWAK